MHIRDVPSVGSGQVANAVAAAWNLGAPDSHAMAAVCDLREGFTQGGMDSAATSAYTGRGPVSEPCTFIKVNNGPFDDWMFSSYFAPATEQLQVTFTKAGETDKTVTVLDVDDPIDPVFGQCFRKLVVDTDSLPAWITTGASYHVHGRRYKTRAAQSGTWQNVTTPGGTVFKLSPYAALTEYMVGWQVQPRFAITTAAMCNQC